MIWYFFWNKPWKFKIFFFSFTNLERNKSRVLKFVTKSKTFIYLVTLLKKIPKYDIYTWNNTNLITSYNIKSCNIYIEFFFLKLYLYDCPSQFKCAISGELRCEVKIFHIFENASMYFYAPICSHYGCIFLANHCHQTLSTRIPN